MPNNVFRPLWIRSISGLAIISTNGKSRSMAPIAFGRAIISLVPARPGFMQAPVRALGGLLFRRHSFARIILRIDVGDSKRSIAVDLHDGFTLRPSITVQSHRAEVPWSLRCRAYPPTVTLDDFTAAIERLVAGLEKKSRVLSPEERRRVAYHEMGHALVAATLSGVNPVHKVSIIPRGVGVLRYTMQRPTQDRFLLARRDLDNRIAVLMGGRAAEALIFDGEVSTGASDDLQRATEIATKMVTRYGMAETRRIILRRRMRPSARSILRCVISWLRHSTGHSKCYGPAAPILMRACDYCWHGRPATSEPNTSSSLSPGILVHWKH